MQKAQVALGVVALLALLLVARRPSDHGGPYPPAYAALNQQLRREMPGRNQVLLDLAVVHTNAATIRAAVHPAIQIRIVTKSLPSLPLLAHLMERLGTQKLMVFSEPFLEAVLEKFGTEVDVLLGKPLPAEAAFRIGQVYETQRICWLIDSMERLTEYQKLTMTSPRRVCVELDVGLRRGGVSDPETFVKMLEFIQSHPEQLRFGGVMGYDGHVPHAIPLLTNADDEFAAVLERYRSLVRAGKTAVPALFGGDLIFDGGGSHTFWRYGPSVPDLPVNEISLGSAFVVPSHFSDLSVVGLAPALTLAAPVLKTGSPELPFISGVGSLLSYWDPNLSRHFFLLGGGWPADPVAPPGMQRHFLWDDGPPVQNLLPNQPLLTGSNQISLEPGDFVFFRPWEGDAITSFSQLSTLEDGKISNHWEVFRGGN